MWRFNLIDSFLQNFVLFGWLRPPAKWGNLDHSQGKWFAPGEALPPGFVVTTHPEGHTAPQEGHLMTDKASCCTDVSQTDLRRTWELATREWFIGQEARESFVITTGTAGSSLPTKTKAWICGLPERTRLSKLKMLRSPQEAGDQSSCWRWRLVLR